MAKTLEGQKLGLLLAKRLSFARQVPKGTWEEEARLDSYPGEGTNDWKVEKAAFDYITDLTGLVPDVDLFSDFEGSNALTQRYKSRRILLPSGEW